MQTQINLKELSEIDLREVQKKDLADVSGMTFDTSIPKEQRAAQIIRTINNPYCFRVGDMGVKLEFTDSGPSLQDCLTDLLKRKKSGL